MCIESMPPEASGDTAKEWTLMPIAFVPDSLLCHPSESNDFSRGTGILDLHMHLDPPGSLSIIAS